MSTVARQLVVCTATVYSLCARGEPPDIRIFNAIRVAQADLEAFLSRSRKSHPYNVNGGISDRRDSGLPC